MARRIILFLLSFMTIFLVLTAMLCPRANEIVYNADESSIADNLSFKDIANTHSCIVSENGEIKITGDDAYITFNNLSTDLKYLEIFCKKSGYGTLSGRVYFDNGNGFSEEAFSTFLKFYENNKVSAFAIGKTISSIRIDIDDDYTLLGLKTYNALPPSETFPVEHSVLKYLLAALISTILSAAILILDIKKDFSGRFIAFLKKNVKAILIAIIVICSCAAVSFPVELLLIKFYPLSTNTPFCFKRYFFVFGLLLLISFLVSSRKFIAEKFEKVFLGVAIIVGSMLIICAPFGHISWDTESHYKWALQSSFIGTVYETKSDFSILSAESSFSPKENLLEEEETITNYNESATRPFEAISSDFSLPHLPAGIFLAVLRYLGAPFAACFIFAKFANLILYSTVCFFAIRRLKSGKTVLGIIALFPTSLFLACNYSYDYFVICFSLLGMAIFISELQQPLKKITVKDTVVMCLAFSLAALPKLIYAVFLAIPFFMRKKNFKNRKTYTLICILAFIVLMLFFFLRSSATVTGSGDTRGGDEVNPTLQLKYILSSPISYSKTLIKFLGDYLSPLNANQYTSNFAYLGFGSAVSGIVLLVLLLFATFTDKTDCDRYVAHPVTFFAAIIFFLCMCVATASALYIAFTPVGLDWINGCSLRYLLPLFYPTLSLVGGKRFINNFNRTCYNYVVISVCSAVNVYMLCSHYLNLIV